MTELTRIAALLPLLALVACGGGGGGGGVVTSVASPNFLTVPDVEKVIAQAVAEAQAQNAKATIAVVDRVGNVLGVFKMNGAAPMFTITSGPECPGYGSTQVSRWFFPMAAVLERCVSSTCGRARSTRRIWTFSAISVIWCGASCC